MIPLQVRYLAAREPEHQLSLSVRAVGIFLYGLAATPHAFESSERST